MSKAAEKVMPATSAEPAPVAFLSNGGEMGRLINSFDWSKTNLGPIAAWPQSLKTTINIMLQSPVAIVTLWGEDGVMIYNDAYSRFAGAKHPSQLGQVVKDGWPEVADFNKNVLKVVLAGQTLSYKDQSMVLYRNDTPEDVWLDLNYSPVLDEQGNPAGVLAIVIETTSRMVLQRQQKADAQQIIDVLESTGDAVFMLDKDWRIVRVNKVHERVTRTDRKKIVGKNFWEVFPAGPDSKYWIEHHKVMTTRKASHFDEYYEPLDLWTETNVYPTHDGGISVFFRDITARRKSEAALRQQLQITETVTNNASACLFMIDRAGLITYLNDSATKVTGFTAKDVIGRPMHSVLHHSRPDGSEYPEAECPMVQTYKFGKPNPRHEDIFYRKDGAPFPVLISGTPVKHSGKTDFTIVEFRDITEEKKALQEQKRLVLVTHQRNELLKLNSAKDEFIALASHQLRTPATAVKQYISMVLDGFTGPLEDSHKQFLQTAYESNERQLKIISDLLKTAQIDSNRYSLKKKIYKISDIIRESVEDMQPALELNDQKIALNIKDVLPKLLVDDVEIKLVLINLLENASKYSHPGSTINVTARKKVSKVQIEVSDTGVGIKPDDIRKIFEKFTRIDNELSDTVTGTGLGLYWAKRIIKLHGGTLKVKSEPGKGSTFTVSLPL